MKNKLAKLGYSLISTGGGCTSYIKELIGNDSNILITATESADAPTHETDKVTVGIYDIDGDLIASCNTTLSLILDGSISLF